MIHAFLAGVASLLYWLVVGVVGVATVLLLCLAFGYGIPFAARQFAAAQWKQQSFALRVPYIFRLCIRELHPFKCSADPDLPVGGFCLTIIALAIGQALWGPIQLRWFYVGALAVSAGIGIGVSIGKGGVRFRHLQQRYPCFTSDRVQNKAVLARILRVSPIDLLYAVAYQGDRALLTEAVSMIQSMTHGEGTRLSSIAEEWIRGQYKESKEHETMPDEAPRDRQSLVFALPDFFSACLELSRALPIDIAVRTILLPCMDLVVFHDKYTVVMCFKDGKYEHYACSEAKVDGGYRLYAWSEAKAAEFWHGVTELMDAWLRTDILANMRLLDAGSRLRRSRWRGARLAMEERFLEAGTLRLLMDLRQHGIGLLQAYCASLPAPRLVDLIVECDPDDVMLPVASSLSEKDGILLAAMHEAMTKRRRAVSTTSVTTDLARFAERLCKAGCAAGAHELLVNLLQNRESGRAEASVRDLSAAHDCALSLNDLEDFIAGITWRHEWGPFEVTRYHAYSCSYVVSEGGAARVRKLCDNKTRAVSNLLHLLGGMDDGECLVEYREVNDVVGFDQTKAHRETIDCSAIREVAAQELVRRGNPAYDPQAYCIID